MIDSNPWLMYLFDAPFCWIVFWTLVVSYVFIGLCENSEWGLGITLLDFNQGTELRV